MNLRFSAPLVAITLLAVPAATPAATFVIIDALNDTTGKGIGTGGGYSSTPATNTYTNPITNPGLGTYTSTVNWSIETQFETYDATGAPPRHTATTLPDGSPLGWGLEINRLGSSTLRGQFTIPISATSAAADIGYFDLSFFADFRTNPGVPTFDLVNLNTGVSYLGGAQNVDISNGTADPATTAWTPNPFPAISSAGTNPGDIIELSFSSNIGGGSNGLQLTHISLIWAPEPSRAMLLLCGAVACIFRSARRTQGQGGMVRT